MPGSKHPGRAYLKRLLADRNQYPDRIDAIDARLRRAFENRVAILVLDMCGFSRLTELYGVIHYLAMIQQMEAAAGPAVEANGGKVIKQEADNLFAIFDAPDSALEAALDIFRAFDSINSVVPDERDIYGSVGIGFGETLVIAESDLFGPEMNLASRLGEDLAGRSEILLTPAAYGLLPRGRYRLEPATYRSGHGRIDCYRFKAAVRRRRRRA